jgi:riboflavin synthase
VPYYASFMFTGLIEEVGNVVAAPNKAEDQLTIAAPQLAQQVRKGDSIAVNGCCLTLSSLQDNTLGFDLLQETIARTNLKNLERGNSLNLERALSVDQRLGGHFVQGHIDCVSPIVSFEKRGSDFRLEIELPREFARYVASKGSIAVNGISLTVAEVLPTSFIAWIIPYTKENTNLNRAKRGDLINLEFDILAKYVERMLPGITKHNGP